MIHVPIAMYSAAAIAVYAAGTIPQLGFVHEDSGDAFCLDIANLFRTSDTIPVAFEAFKLSKTDPSRTLDQHARRLIGKRLKDGGLIDKMITKEKDLFNGSDDSSGHA